MTLCRHRQLQCWESMSLCKTKLFVLVTAAEEVLLWEVRAAAPGP